jgi:cobalt/nickel transport system permease protein
MSHLHLPDGLLPLWLWLPALIVVVVLLVISGKTVEPRRLAYQGSLGAMMLAAMSVPLGPLDYHLSLAGPVGVLLGPAAAFQVVFVVTAILAFLGHGGFTVIGLNTLVLSVAAVGAHLGFAATARRMRIPGALALATAVGQTLSGLLWLAIVMLALRSPQRPMSLGAAPAKTEVMTAVVIALWLVGALVESVVAWGIGRFLSRVRPGLLPAADQPAADQPVAGAA